MNIKIGVVEGSHSICIEPQTSRRQKPSWVMWIYPNGNALLWTHREESGAVIGNPIELPANTQRSSRKKNE